MICLATAKLYEKEEQEEEENINNENIINKRNNNNNKQERAQVRNYCLTAPSFLYGGQAAHVSHYSLYIRGVKIIL